MTELDRIYEAAVADDWEEQNAPNKDAEKLKRAAAKLRVAESLLSFVTNFLESATEITKDTPAEDRIASLMDGVDGLKHTIRHHVNKYERGIHV